MTNTRRKTSFSGIPRGRSSSFNKSSAFIRAHLAMAVGPLAPASTAMIAITITLSSGCSRFTVDRGSSNCLKCRMTSFKSTRTILAIALPPFQIENENTETMVYHIPRKSASALFCQNYPECALALPNG